MSGRYGSRKFLLALLVILLATGLLYLRLLDGTQWVTIVGSAMLFYGAANVGQKALTNSGPTPAPVFEKRATPEPPR